MTLLNYTDPIPLPAPVTTGTTVQSYIDPLGDVWVAKNAVNGGNWYRARDVLHARVSRSTALTTSVATVSFTWINADWDVYGLWNGSTSLAMPIPGIYGISVRLDAVATAAGQNLFFYFTTVGLGGNQGGMRVHSGAVTDFSASVYEQIKSPGGTDAATVFYATNVALALGTNSYSNRFSVSYLGTG